MAAAHIAAFTGGTEALGLLLGASPERQRARCARQHPAAPGCPQPPRRWQRCSRRQRARRVGRAGRPPLSCAGAGHTEVVAALLAAGAPTCPPRPRRLRRRRRGVYGGGEAPGDELARCVTRPPARREAAKHGEVALLLLGFGEGEADSAACGGPGAAALPASLGGLLVAACGAGATLPVLRLRADASPDSAVAVHR